MYKEKLKVHFNQGSKILVFYDTRSLNTAMAFYTEHKIPWERR